MPDPSGGVAPGDRVTLHYTLSLASGKMVDTTRDKAPAVLVVGAADLLPAFEQRLLGLHVGEVRRFGIPCMEAFGPSDMDSVQAIPRNEFPGGLEPTAGLVVAFELPSGDEVPGTVVEVTDREVYVNFSHPLAGYDLIFETEILRVETPSAPEP